MSHPGESLTRIAHKQRFSYCLSNIYFVLSNLHNIPGIFEVGILFINLFVDLPHVTLVSSRRKTKFSLVTRRGGLDVNPDKTKYMIMSRDQNAGRCCNMKIDNSFIESVEEFKYLGTKSKNQISVQEEIKSRLKLGNACYYSAQDLLSSRLLSKNLKIKIYKTIILPVVLCGCETWSLTLREELRLRVFENRLLRRVFGPTRDEVTGEWRNYIMRSLVICTPYPILGGW